LAMRPDRAQTRRRAFVPSEDSGMDLAGMLIANRDVVLEHASGALGRAHLAHYEASGFEESRQRLDDLFDLVTECLTSQRLAPIFAYSERVANERFSAGFAISEVQTAFNVLEEAIWQVVVVSLTGSDLVEAAGLIGTVLGAGKDALARTWVALSTSQHVPSLDLAALFEGAAS
jgi:hypothetical protein